MTLAFLFIQPSEHFSATAISVATKCYQRTAVITRQLPTSTRLYSTTRPAASAFSLSSRLTGLDKPTVWHEFSPLAVEHKSINLGQGFPDWDPPDFVQQAMVNSVVTTGTTNRQANQYARSFAHMPLAVELAQDYSSKLNRKAGIDPATEIATGVGCTNVLYCALQGLINPIYNNGKNNNKQDEVILLEPAFDIYAAQVTMAGGKPVYVPLRPNINGKLEANQVFTLDLAELEAAITHKTKVLILNTPHNPTGKMFTRSELEGIANIIKQHPQITIISDEVYEHIVFNDNDDDDDNEKVPHISIASLSEDMWQQTLTLNSSGKTFSCTGWKVGWAIGPSRLVQAVRSVQQWVNFSVPTPNQDAIAQVLQQARQQDYVATDAKDGTQKRFNNYYDYLAAEYLRKRDILADALNEAGLTPIIPPGAFFIMADTSSIDDVNTFPYEKYSSVRTEAAPTYPLPRDWAMSRWLTQEIGVTAIPPSSFFRVENAGLASNLLRFAFCKGDDTLLEAKRRLAKIKS